MFPFLTIRSHSIRRTTMFLALATSLVLSGCKSASAPASNSEANTPPAPRETYPPRPTVPPPAFKIFKHINSSFTLTVKPDATDEQIESLIWELRDASRTRTLDKIKISQKTFDADGDSVYFHIYRGSRCASEKYAPGVVCGGGYHASGDYTYTTVHNQPWDAGTLLHDEDHRIRLWDSDASYTPPAGSSAAK